jgi:hypothetical protein
VKQWCLQPVDAADPVYVQMGKMLIEFGGWLGVLNCNNSGLEAFVSDGGNLNFLPTFLGGGDNGIIHGDLGSSIKAGRRSPRSSPNGSRRRSS